ncbi:iron chelate uptake ABC transporter family permease subunit, partial [Bordetella hinzii]|nr:iron chelate uptake ABC transporter family permease subunit [Bordetella hinzii]
MGVSAPRRAPWAARSGLAAACVLLIALCLVSIGLGAGQFSYAELLGGDKAERAWQLLMISRVPRTLALLLAGMSLAVAGLLMQMLVRNRYVEPSTAGTIESATLGILVVTLLAPGAPVLAKMLTATGFGLAGSLLFLALLRRVPLRSPFLVPLIGLILGGIIHAVTTYLA